MMLNKVDVYLSTKKCHRSKTRELGFARPSGLKRERGWVDIKKPS